MSSIRPLVTITILVVVGVFLFNKINEGPAHVPHGASVPLESAPLAEVPPLSPIKPTVPAPNALGNSPGTGELAPQWTGEAPPTTLPAAPEASAITATPAVPAIPELPPLSPAPETISETTPGTASPTSIPLPTNIPTAQYHGEVGASSAALVAETVAPAAISSATVTESVSAAPPAAESVAAQANTTPVAPEEDRYAVTNPEAVPVAEPVTSISTTPLATTMAVTSVPSFATSWPQIQGALERQELVAAHEMLSQWYGNPNLTPSEKEQVEGLLGQLAGTVVYSTEHRLEPPYTVHAGDTLQTIAQQYEVPWQLLAKINGIPAANMVQPGQQLKVVHGPFSAVVELYESQMTLMLDGRYAGRFPITVEPSAQMSEGQWVLEQKLVNPTTEASGVVSASYAPAAVDRVLVLRNESPTAGGATISITGGPTAPSGPTAVAPAAIRLSARDAEEVADILSVGSTVTIRK